MACGICRAKDHRRETCPQKGTAAGVKAAHTCGGCHRTDGTHAPKCQRGKVGQPSVPARKGRPSPASPSNGPGRYAAAIAALETEAGALEAQAKQVRDVAERLRALAR